MKNLNLSLVFSAVILVFVVVALLPDVFNEVTQLENETGAGANVPDWVASIMIVIVAGGFVMLIWNLFGNKMIK